MSTILTSLLLTFLIALLVPVLLLLVGFTLTLVDFLRGGGASGTTTGCNPPNVYSPRAQQLTSQHAHH